MTIETGNDGTTVWSFVLRHWSFPSRLFLLARLRGAVAFVVLGLWNSFARAGDGVGHGHDSLLRRLVGHVAELGVGFDPLDGLPLDDLVAERVHQAPLLQPGPHLARRFV